MDCCVAARGTSQCSIYPPAVPGGLHARAGGHALKEATAHRQPLQEQSILLIFLPCFTSCNNTQATLKAIKAPVEHLYLVFHLQAHFPLSYSILYY